MAQPVNLYDTYDTVGIREDLSDVIHNYDAHETLFFSGAGKSKAKATLHEWQIDTLRASAVNAHIEGDDTVPTAITPTTRVGNYTQIFKESASISGTDEAVDKAGRGKEMGYQLLKKTKELRLDVEKAIFNNVARDSGNTDGKRYLAGAPAWITTNTANVGGGGANPTGDGTDARTDGTQTAFTQADFDTVMQGVWESGGRPDCVYLSAFQMNLALGFTGNNNQRSTVAAGKGRAMVVNDIDVYMTPWGAVTFKPVRENRSRDVFIMQSDTWEIATLRPLKNKPLAQTGDSEKRQMVTELTLVCKSEKVNGIVADCTTS